MLKRMCFSTMAVLLSMHLLAQLNPFPECYKIDKKDLEYARKIIKKEVPELKFPNPSPDAQWFTKNNLGLMMHWGPHTVLGAQPSWDMVPMDAEWGGKVMPSERYYEETLEAFNPQNYDPEKFLKAAKEAGYSYVVLTSKHHDGFANWPSKYGLSTRQYMGGRDLIKPYIEACRKLGLKVGLYFSPRDWYYPGYPAPVKLKGLKEPAIDQKTFFEDFFAYTICQMKELLTNYGQIDILWFDSFGLDDRLDYYNGQVYAWIRSLQPGILLNDRYHDMPNPENQKEMISFGDFQTPFECYLPDYKPKGLWEDVEIWTNGRAGWGYDTMGDFKSWQWFFTYFLTTRSMGGNLLLNASPGPTGDMHPNYYLRTATLAEWMKHSQESVMGTDPSPGRELCNVFITARPGIYYLHLLPEYRGDIRLRIDKYPGSVTVLRTGKSLNFTYKSGVINISIPNDIRTDMDDVIKVVL